MKIKFLLLLVLIVSISCEKEASQNKKGNSKVFLPIQIDQPNHFQTVLPNTIVNFKGRVKEKDDTRNYSSIKSTWRSNIDGILEIGFLSEAGNSNFSTDKLSNGAHTIQFEVINEENEVSKDSIVVYNGIQLFSIEDKQNFPIIKWASTEDPEFLSYELFRSNYEAQILDDEPIFITESNKDTLYSDSDVLLGRKYFYKIILNRLSEPKRIESNIEFVTTGVFVTLDYPILKLVSDPIREFVYGIANTDNIYEDSDGGYGLFVLNTTTHEIESRVFENIRFTDIEIGPNAEYLYACFRNNVIYKISIKPETRWLTDVLYLSNFAHKIEVGNNNRLYYHITPPTSGSTEFRIYDLENDGDLPYKDTMTDAYSSFNHGDIELSEDNILFHGGSNISSAYLSKIGTTDDTFSIIKQWDSRNYQSPKITLRNNRIFWNHYLLDTELNLLGTFQVDANEINIMDVSLDGDFALGSQYLFNSSDQSVNQKLPVSYNGGTFLEDKTLLLFDNKNPISDIRESTIFFYPY